MHINGIAMRYLKNVVLTTLFSLILYSCQEADKGIQPEYVPLTESVYSSVIIEPDSFYKVYASTMGIVDQLLVKEGDLIKNGDVILRIVSDNSKLQSDNAALELNLASQNYEGNSNLIQDLKNNLEIAQLKRINDSANFQRQKRLWDQKIGSKNDFEQRELAYQASLNEVSLLKKQIQRKQDELKITLQKSKNNYTNKLNNQADFEVKSRVNGKVYELLKEEGESISIQEPVALIGSSSQFVIKMQVDELDIVRIEKGQLIYVTLDAYNDEVYKAVVIQIIPQMNQETQTFWVEGLFMEAPKVLYSGLRGEASIVIAQKDKVLTIPLEYLMDGKKVISEAGTLHVKTGLRSLEKVEILEGIDSTTIIQKP